MHEKKKSPFSPRFTTASLALIPAAIGINFVGKLVVSLLKLPLWMDSIGTILASMLAGPWIGAIAGAVNNVIYGFQDPISIPYALTSVAMGVTVGVMAHYGWTKSFWRVIVLALVMCVISTIVSVPINIIFWEGMTGNVWGDAAYGIILAKTHSVLLASTIDSLIIGIPDSIASVIIAWGLFKALPKNLLQLYKTNTDVEEF
ncbi:MAG: ECF transporter S component [Clostridiales Family XIII bacterium]|jgi:energy-coupling factor transport system substrate-specific component|nr:ECF transporter S component [Clostridiales Family XIII bacterium]